MTMSWNAENSIFSAKPPKRGILRSVLKKPTRPRYREVQPVKKDEPELLVFGYASKLYPPDEHSRQISRDHHLIPWNGDNNLQLMIDRYDARASLHNLSEFDSDSWNKHYEISEEEVRIEQLCDQQRYLALYTDIAEENIRQEEELKRLHASIASSEQDSQFKEVGFNYEAPPVSRDQKYDPFNPTKENEESSLQQEAEEEKPFMAPSSLSVPSDMEIPPTEKMHAIIEKTAGFVSSQGAQMEIVLKAKQANNSQFLFLQFDHYLNPYYKNMVKRIKEGKYRPGISDKKEAGQDDEDSDSSSGGEGGYLHPSLFAKKKDVDENKEKFKAIQKVDPNHPLAKLIEKGKRANALKQYNLMKNAAESSGKNSPETSSLGTHEGKESMLEATFKQQHELTQPIVPPPPDIQPMVDSIARQIAEEGDSVEDHMRARDDPMLAFLLPSHELHAYYFFRKTFIREQLQEQERKKIAEEKAASSLNNVEQETDDAAKDEFKPDKAAPISFSIKPKKESSKKSNLLPLPNRLQMLGDDEEDEEDEIMEEDVKESREEKEMNDENDDKVMAVEEEKQESTQSRVTVLNKEVENPENFQDKVKLQETSFSSNFTVVTPSGTAASISDVREKQAARRQKATMFLIMKSKNSPADQNQVDKSHSLPSAASEDIFDIEEDETPPANDDQGNLPMNSVVSEEQTPKNRPLTSIDLPNVSGKSSPSLTSVSASLTLKDLVAAAASSHPSIPLSPDSKKDRKRYRSRSKSPSRNSSPSLSNRKRRSRSRDFEALPSSYRKIRSSSRENLDSYMSSSLQRNRPGEDESVPSAYKIENPEPLSQSNGNFSRGNRSRNRDSSPSGTYSRRSHKRHRRDSERDEDKKKHRSHRSSSHKSKKKHHRSSKTKKKHKKSEKKKHKKKKEKESSSEEGEWSSSDGENSIIENKDTEVAKSESPAVKGEPDAISNVNNLLPDVTGMFLNGIMNLFQGTGR